MSDAPKSAPRAHVLVVEDSSVFREMQTLLLGQAGYAVSGHEHPQTALAAARERKFELVIIDYELPEMNGQQFMHELRKILPDIAIIFVSGSLTLELAITLSRQGVAGIFNKPANPKTLLEKINETLSRTGSREAALPGKGSAAPVPPTATRGAPASPFPPTATVAPVGPSPGELAYTPRFFPGQGDAFREFSHRLWKVRDFRSVLLLQGETGTPFELIARDLAAISVFRDGPVMVCSAAQFETRHLIEVLAPTLLSQDAGTLIITGVESFTPEQQAVLQTLTASRDVFQPFARRFRLVLAAVGHLSDLADAGTFDETLYYKISSISLEIPALRDLREDILLHARQLLDQQAAANKAAKSPALSTAAASWLEQQEWAGNYADLARTLQLAVASDRGSELGVPALSAAFDRVVAEAGKPAPARVSAPVASEELAVPVSPRVTPAPAPVAVAPAPLPPPVVVPTSVANPPFAVPAVVAATESNPVSAPVPAAPAVSKPAPAKPSGLTGRSVFRPVSSAYDFSKRLAESLASAGAGAS